MGSVAEELGDFVAASSWDAVPEPVRAQGRRSLLNFLGCALGVAREEPVDAAARVLAPLSGPQRVTVLGRSERLDLLGAAFVNAIAGNLLDYDDTHLRTVIHPTAPVAPVALGLGELHGLSGRDVLHALLLGMEVECRIGNAVSPGHYARGWHITSTCGIFGAAAAACRLMRLDGPTTAHALGVAASQSAGIVENLPSAAKNVSVGNAARNGLFAAMLAQQGYRAAPASIEGPLGWARAMGDTPDTAAILDGLGVQWEAGRNTFKPYPCGIVMHAVIDACLLLRRQNNLAAGGIAEVVVSGEQLLLDRGDRVVRNERDARVSIHHCAAVVFLYGRAGLAEFAEAAAMAPDVVSFRGKVRAELDAASPRGAATATVRTTDGRLLSATVADPKGSEAQPLSDREIEAKVDDLLRQGGFGPMPPALPEAVRRIDTMDTIAPLLEVLGRFR